MVTVRGSFARMIGSFAALHAVNAALATGFGLVQLLVFARMLGVDRYAEIILLMTIGMFILPLDIASGRAAYAALREDVVKGRKAEHWPEVATFLSGQFLFLTLLSFLPLLLFPHHDAETLIEDIVYLNVFLIGNFLMNDLQFTAWAINLNPRFILLILGRTLAQFAALGVLAVTGRFMDFAILAFLANSVLFVLLARFVRRHSDLELRIWRVIPAATALWKQVRRFGSTLLSSLTEMVVLTLPYGLLTGVFGVGPALIAYDTIMKLMRVVTAFARMLIEITLPKITHALHTDNVRSAWLRYLLVLGVCALGGVSLALVLVLEGDLVFRLLLGPSDVMPDGIELVAGAIIVTGALFQPAIYLIGLSSLPALRVRFTIAAVGGFAAFAGAVLSGLPLVETIWAYAIYLAMVTAVALLLSRQAILKGGTAGG